MAPARWTGSHYLPQRYVRWGTARRAIAPGERWEGPAAEIEPVLPDRLPGPRDRLAELKKRVFGVELRTE